MSRSRSYDYIIAGAGCAGLSLLVHLIEAGLHKDKRILLIDRDAKNLNDRTWCFWETSAGLFEPVVYRQWDKAWVHHPDGSKLMPLSPFWYKLIRGIDFYGYALERIKQEPGIELLTADITEIRNGSGLASVTAGGERYEATWVFSSIAPEKPVLRKGDYYLLQHFRGWVVEAAVPVFDPEQPILMDFRVGQDDGTTFVYVLPFSANKALVEFTLFSPVLWPMERYEQGLRDYLQARWGLTDYRVSEEEFGIIPMTNHRYPVSDGAVIQLGSAGGQTKPSSGYTFRFIQKHSKRIVDCLRSNIHPARAGGSGAGRFRFYDSTLLHILQHRTLPGDRIFSRLFFRNPAARVFRFLDNDSKPAEELKLIASLPTGPFLRAALKQL